MTMTDTITAETITEDQLLSLEAEAGAAGDQELALIARRARLNDDAEARAEARRCVAAVIAEAQALHAED